MTLPKTNSKTPLQRKGQQTLQQKEEEEKRKAKTQKAEQANPPKMETQKQHPKGLRKTRKT